MNDTFIAHMEGAIASSPNVKIAQQLRTLLNRLKMTNGEVPSLPGVDAAPPVAPPAGE